MQEIRWNLLIVEKSTDGLMNSIMHLFRMGLKKGESYCVLWKQRQFVTYVVLKPRIKARPIPKDDGQRYSHVRLLDLVELRGTPHFILEQLPHSPVKQRLDLDKSKQGVLLRVLVVCLLEEVFLDGLVHLLEVSLCLLVLLPLAVGGRGRRRALVVVAVFCPLRLQRFVHGGDHGGDAVHGFKDGRVHEHPHWTPGKGVLEYQQKHIK